MKVNRQRRDAVVKKRVFCVFIIFTFLISGMLFFGREQATDKNKILLEAVKSNKVNDVIVLLNSGADPDGKPHSLSDYGSSPLKAAIYYNNLKMVSVLLHRGADPNFNTYTGSPLTQAVQADSPQLIEALIQGGATVNHDNGYAFRRAIIDGKTASVKALINHGADPNMTWDGKSALQVATEFKHFDIAKTLRDSGAK